MKKARVSKTAQVNLMMLADLVERVPLYTDSLELRSLQQVSPETAAEVIGNWRNTSALIVR